MFIGPTIREGENVDFRDMDPRIVNLKVKSASTTSN